MFFYNGLVGLAIMAIFVFSFVKEIFMKFKNGTYNNQIVLLSLITIVILVSKNLISEYTNVTTTKQINVVLEPDNTT